MAPQIYGLIIEAVVGSNQRSLQGGDACKYSHDVQVGLNRVTNVVAASVPGLVAMEPEKLMTSMVL